MKNIQKCEKHNPSMSIKSHSRRHFIKYTSGGILATALSQQMVLGANSRVRLGLIGSGMRGTELTRTFMRLENVDIAAVSDPDTDQMDTLFKKIEKAGQTLGADKIQDYRKLLERQDIDAVVIASPNHWHALHAIQALEAGKHVYLEKPVTYSLWEGQQLEAAEKKYPKLIFAGGHQNRSDPGPQRGIEYVQKGKLGKIKRVRSLCFRNRNSIGKQDQPLKPPQTMDYNLWLGPAEDQPIYRPNIHYDWHWDFNTGCGDIGNQAPHEIDMACWVLGDPALPKSIQCFGERFAWNDAGNTPNIQIALYEAGGVECIVEVNDLKLSPDRNVASSRLGVGVGIIVECEKGILKGGRGGMQVVELDGKTDIEKFPGDGGKSHQSDFIQAIIEGKRNLINCRITDAQKSASIAHLANISFRTGEKADRLPDRFREHEALQDTISAQAEQLKHWGIDDPKYVVGQEIEVNPVTQTLATTGIPSEITGPRYRQGFELLH